MGEGASGVSQPGQVSQPPHSFVEKIKELPWVEIAMILGVIGLSTIGLLAGFNVLTHIGTLSAQFIQNAAEYGIFGLGVIAIVRAVTKLFESGKENVTYISSKQLKPKEEPLSPPKLEQHFHMFEMQSTREYGMCYGKVSNSKSTQHPSKCQIQIGDETVTLYGLYPPFDSNEKTIFEMESLIEQELKSKKFETEEDLKDLKASLDKVAQKYGVSLVVDVGDSVVVSAKSGYYAEIDAQNKNLKVYPLADKKIIHKSSQHARLLIGNPEAIKNIFDKGEGWVKNLMSLKATVGNSMARLLTAAKGAKEISLIFLEMGPSPRV